MRWPWLVVLVLIAGCSGPVTARPSASPVAHASATPGTLSTGGIVEYPIPAPPCSDNCNPGAGTIALGPDGSMWFVDTGAQVLGRVTPAGKFTQLKSPVQLAGGAQTLVTGPDGYLWVLGRGNGSSEPDWVLRVAPNGEITKFPTTSINAGTESIAAGPDGNVWFTEFWTNRIGRITTQGVVTEFSIPSGEAHPRGIGAGPDGNLWFAEDNSERPAIGRITTAGVVTEFTVGHGHTDSPPYDVIGGPDGNIWFTRWLGDSVGTISPAGQVASVALPQGSRTNKLVAGPDGNIWFTDSGLNAIGRMSVTGAVRDFPLPRRNSLPFGIAVGGDRRIWFSEGDRLGSIGLRVPEALLSERVMIFGDTSAKKVTVTNTGDAALAFGSVNVTGVDGNAFVRTGDTCTGKSLSPGARCEITVARSSSTSSNVQSAFLEFVDDATGSPQRISLVAQLGACKLPVVVSVPNTPPQGSMLDTTTGHGLYEPRGGFTATATTPSRVQTVTEPVLTGVTSGYYDRAAGRWLPVPDSSWVSPDGSRYVFIDFDSGSTRDLHVVDVSTGHERVLPMGPGFWTVVAFTAQGIYVHQAYEGIAPGLWLVNPDTGATRQVLTDGVVNAVTGSTAWVGVRNPAATLPQWGIGGGSDEIDSRDLAGGATRAWLYVPGSQMYVPAVYDGMPVVTVETMSGRQMLVVTSPNQTKPLDLPLTDDASPSLSGFISDTQGLWIGTPDGVYLWTLRTGGILVSSEPGTPAGTCA